MKGIQITAVGALEDVIAVTDLPEPKEPEPGEVMVGVEYAPLNFHDLGERSVSHDVVRAGRFRARRPPRSDRS
jgi:NADPH:quinone reductase-like Zn-dependent oxidoreductase